MSSSKKKGIASTAGLNKRKTPSNSTPDNRNRKAPSNTTDDDDDFFATPANDDEDDWDGTSTGSRSSKKQEKGSSRATSEESFKGQRKPRRRKLIVSDSEEDEEEDRHRKTKFMNTFMAFEYQQPDLETGRPLSKKRARVAGHVVDSVQSQPNEEEREEVRAKKFKQDHKSRNAQKAAGDWMSTKMTGSQKSTPTADKPICDISAHPRAQEQLKAADPTQTFTVIRPINLSSKAHVAKERTSMLELHRALSGNKEYLSKGKPSEYLGSLVKYIELLTSLRLVVALTPKNEAKGQEEEKAPSHGASAPIVELVEAVEKASPKTLKRMLEEVSDGQGAMEALEDDAEDDAHAGAVKLMFKSNEVLRRLAKERLGEQ